MRIRLLFLSSKDRDMFIDYLLQEFAGCCDFCELLEVKGFDSCNGFGCPARMRDELVSRSVVLFPFWK